MGAIIDGANKSADLHGAGVHGFTAGDAATKMKPTSLTSAWCNAIQQEINTAITHIGISLNSGVRQLGAAIQSAVFTQKLRSGDSPSWKKFQSHSGSGAGANVYQYSCTQADINKAVGGTHNLDSPALDNGVYSGLMTVQAVRTGNDTLYWNCEYNIWCRVTGGTVFVSHANLIIASQNTSGVTFSSANSGSGSSLRTAITIGAGAGTYNLAVSWRLTRTTAS